MEFHLQQHEPNANWPKGSWSLYRITGATIADRTIWERVNGKLQITERWPWPGYVGMFESFDDAVAAMKKEAGI